MTSQEILGAGVAHDELWLKEIALQLALYNEACAASAERNAELDARDAEHNAELEAKDEAREKAKQGALNDFVAKAALVIERIGATFGPPPGAIIAPMPQPGQGPRMPHPSRPRPTKRAKR